MPPCFSLFTLATFSFSCIKKIRRIWSGFFCEDVYLVQFGTTLPYWTIIFDNLWWIISNILAGYKKDTSVLRTCACPLLCLSVIYIEKSLKCWKKYFFCSYRKDSGSKLYLFPCKNYSFWGLLFSVFWFLKRRYI